MLEEFLPYSMLRTSLSDYYRRKVRKRAVVPERDE